MPRITAPTVAEHRDQRRVDLVAAGQELFVTEGPDAVTMTAVATRAGLSRTAVYEYFTSTDELVAVVLGDQMVLWQEALRQRLHATSPETGDLDTVRIYVEVAMGLVADGHHSSGAADDAYPREGCASPIVLSPRRGRRSFR